MTYHELHVLTAIHRFYHYVGMKFLEDPEDLIGKCLSYGIDTVEIQDHLLEVFQ